MFHDLQGLSQLLIVQLKIWLLSSKWLNGSQKMYKGMIMWNKPEPGMSLLAGYESLLVSATSSPAG